MPVDIEDIVNKVERISQREFETPTQHDVVQMKDLIMEIIQKQKIKNITSNGMNALKQKYNVSKKNSFLMQVYEMLVENNDPDISSNDEELFANAIRIKRGKSHSGVIVLTIMLSPYPEYTDQNGIRQKQEFSCRYNCIFCPNDPSMPRSYLALEPSCLRGYQNKFDVCDQIWSRINSLRRIGHRVITKCEVIVEGGTWASFPVPYREEYCRDIYYALNVYWDPEPRRDRLSIEEEKRINQTARSRMSGLIIETRPDNVTFEEIKLLRRYGCTRVQLGIQHLDQDVLNLNKRQCTTQHAKDAIKLLKDCGFKIDIHIMPNMYGSSILKDRNMLLDRFLGLKFPIPRRVVDNKNELIEEYDVSEPDLQADHWKIYPCQVVPWTELKKLYESGIYKPYPEKDLIDLLLETKSLIFNWIRLNRCVRDIPTDYIYSTGTAKGNLRGELVEIMKINGTICRCIRCREVKEQAWDGTFKMTTRIYRSSGGIEYFISAESADNLTLYGFVRLRIPSHSICISHPIFPELTGCAFIRELHCYGEVQSTEKREKDKNNVQHHGIGRTLLQKAEDIAFSKHNYRKIAVISGEGVKEYYKKRGYNEVNDNYMIKQK